MDVDDVARFWNDAADGFDDEPDHGLRDPGVRRAWLDLLSSVLPPAPSRVADLGCGTGTLSVLLAQAGYAVHGVDIASRMLRRAAAKATAAQVRAGFAVANVADPPFGRGTFDVVLARHVVWALPDVATVLRRWLDLLAPGGLLVLVEGRWETGTGLEARRLHALVSPLVRAAACRHLPDPALWGGPIRDERFMLVAWPW